MSGSVPKTLPKPVVVAMLIGSAAMMSMAWLGHLRFEGEWSFWTALGVSWMIVLPEYVLNTIATRRGWREFSGAQMASIHLASGVVCVAVVSHLVLGESFSLRTILGFVTMFVAILLIMGGPERKPPKAMQFPSERGKSSAGDGGEVW